MNKTIWKFLLLGITGDLSKRKILPSIAQFSEINKETVDVNLIGYSRSIPDSEEIHTILNNNTSDLENKLSSIDFVQGEYTDPKYFIELTESLKENEHLVVYLATPPNVFLDILSTFCPYHMTNLFILVEKPFGNDREEAGKIFQKVRECRLENNVFFIDHYLFKTSSRLQSSQKEQIEKLLDQNVKEIKIQILEDLDVKNRGGYYDSIGALKDMLPAHFYSLLNLISELLPVSLDLDHLEINNLNLGQYKGYKNDVQNQDSSIETYFQIEGLIGKTHIILESGKKLEKRTADITIKLEDKTFIWNLQPDRILTINQKGKELFNIRFNTDLMDHTNMFNDVLERDFNSFVKTQGILEGWGIWEKVKRFKAENQTKIKQY